MYNTWKTHCHHYERLQTTVRAIQTDYCKYGKEDTQEILLVNWLLLGSVTRNKNKIKGYAKVQYLIRY